MYTLLSQKLPKIFYSPKEEQPDEDTGIIESDSALLNSGSLTFKLRHNKHVSHFHDHMINNKRNKLIPTDSPYMMDNSDRHSLVTHRLLHYIPPV
ncbi:hypothetical protein RclHR1_01340016 [Rhizophagus clarus]|nr:hypothetical protein RclHR1_01340016 [Rhizophagus clarus]